MKNLKWEALQMKYLFLAVFMAFPIFGKADDNYSGPLVCTGNNLVFTLYISPDPASGHYSLTRHDVSLNGLFDDYNTNTDNSNFDLDRPIVADMSIGDKMIFHLEENRLDDRITHGDPSRLLEDFRIEFSGKLTVPSFGPLINTVPVDCILKGSTF